MIFAIRLPLLTVAGCLLASCDPWGDIRPYWGELPGQSSHSFSMKHLGCRVSAHLLKGAEDWVEGQKQRFACTSSEMNDTDCALLAWLERTNTPCIVWRSPICYDIARYQAVQPTFICFDNGDCLFYLYDFYSPRFDIIPPECPELPPLSEQP